MAGGCCPKSSPPEKQRFEPPPMVTAFKSAVRNWAVEASIRVLSAKLVFLYADALTPLRVTRGPVPWRQEPVGEPLLTVKLKSVVLVTPPPVPVTVMREVPAGVDVMVEIVRVVEQVGEHAVGEKTALASVGSPEAEKDTGCAVPETSAALTVVKLEPPWVIVMSCGLSREKLKEEEAATVKLKLVFLCSPPVAVPVTVMVEVPVGVDARVETVRVVEQVGVQEANEKEAVVF